jgi:hypothetical protein
MIDADVNWPVRSARNVCATRADPLPVASTLVTMQEASTLATGAGGGGDAGGGGGDWGAVGFFFFFRFFFLPLASISPISLESASFTRLPARNPSTVRRGVPDDQARTTLSNRLLSTMTPLPP